MDDKEESHMTFGSVFQLSHAFTELSWLKLRCLITPCLMTQINITSSLHFFNHKDIYQVKPKN